MKLKTILLAALLAAFAASTPTSFATDDAMMERAEASKPATGEAKKPVKKKVKKHSHAEEKSGMPMQEAASGVGQHESMMRKDRHDHTKDRH